MGRQNLWLGFFSFHCFLDRCQLYCQVYGSKLSLIEHLRLLRGVHDPHWHLLATCFYHCVCSKQPLPVNQFFCDFQESCCEVWWMKYLSFNDHFISGRDFSSPGRDHPKHLVKLLFCLAGEGLAVQYQTASGHVKNSTMFHKKIHTQDNGWSDLRNCHHLTTQKTMKIKVHFHLSQRIGDSTIGHLQLCYFLSNQPRLFIHVPYNGWVNNIQCGSGIHQTCYVLTTNRHNNIQRTFIRITSTTCTPDVLRWPFLFDQVSWHLGHSTSFF